MIKSSALMRWSNRGESTIRCSSTVLAAVLVTLVVTSGCGDTGGVAHRTTAHALPDDKRLQQDLDEVLEATYRRHLNLEEHAAWQILHGALAFGREFRVTRDKQSDEMVSAVDHILAGGQMKGWTVQQGVALDSGSSRFGLQSLLEQGTKTGQGHRDQWLAILSQCDLDPSQEIRVGDKRYTMRDLVRQAQWDVPRNLEREYSWTLIGLTAYLNTNVESEASWQASDGRTWTIDELVEAEASQARDNLSDGACGGTHRLIGLSMALNRHLAGGGKLGGAWMLADEQIQQAIAKAREYQNDDGSFSTNYFQRPGKSPDLAQNLGTTGHILEFLVLSLNDEQLQEPWVKRAVLSLCDLFRKTEKVSLECGALYHAAHGLVLYRMRVFGERSYGSPSDAVASTARRDAAP